MYSQVLIRVSTYGADQLKVGGKVRVEEEVRERVRKIEYVNFKAKYELIC